MSEASSRRSRFVRRDSRYHHRNGHAHNHHEPPPPPQQHELPPPASNPQPRVTKSSVNTVSYAQQQLGACVTEGMKKAYEECKVTVERIAAQCRAKNRRFRDVDFDLENDSNRCLHNLVENNTFVLTSDIRRVPEIFEKPVFYSGTKQSAEIVQGAVEDCYLVSALSSITSVDKLIKNLCVAHDEDVGIYGFVFYRDCYWVPVIVDDMLFTRVPKYEQLTAVEKELYHFEKEKYNSTARKGAEALYFARPTTNGETWIPLVEKAYAKLHGDYASIMYGRTCDAIEDMTGGVSNLILSKDILDKDKFWHEELVKANQDRLFGCWFKTLNGNRSGIKNASVDGLVGNLSHSVVKAVEIKGKRFVVLRDPWGEAGWEGPWSDGSKEWTKEWLDVLPELGHSFGGKGQFVMEYSDFLNIWQEIQRTLIFDDSWLMSSQWLLVSQPYPHMNALSYGDVSCELNLYLPEDKPSVSDTFSLSKPSPAIIVFSKYNMRYFKDIQGPCIWNLSFILAKEGETEPLAESSYSFFYTRSVSVELDLAAGNYVVLGRLDPVPVRDKDYFRNGLTSGWDRRKLARIITERAKGQSITSNYKPNSQLLSTPVSKTLASEYAKADKTTVDAIKTHSGGVKPGESVTVSTTTTTTTVITKNGGANQEERHARPYSYNPNNISAATMPPAANGYGPHVNGQQQLEAGWVGIAPATPPAVSPAASPPIVPYGGPLPPPPPLDLRPASPTPRPPAPPLSSDVLEEDNSIVVGLKVYTKKIAPTVISGRLRNSPGSS